MANNNPETLAQFYGLFLYKKKDIIAIQEKLDIPFGEIFNLFMCLEEDIIVIQDKLDIVGYSNQERAEEVDENMRACLWKLKEFHGPLENDPDVIFPKYGEMGVKKIIFTGEGLSLFPKLSPQQLHEIFVKNPSSAGQCPCLEQVS
ncbi:hypothetical protein RhiirA4_480741 [Rhizophagus irregularis]|uniref:Uncharacterized protein n=1 Tax=Rhizophagus irregularis TaxID=588596 RepID=A0A2I1HII1_9GLOM|nr:hypothetical protein RhiirA4_480741 [Rhizophagus irregularis]